MNWLEDQAMNGFGEDCDFKYLMIDCLKRN